MAIYLDHAASVPISPEVLVTFTEALAVAGNPSSTHSYGQTTRMLLEDARERIALAVGCDRSEVIFTSGGTESDNLAIKGLFWQRVKEDARRKLIVSAYTEHHGVIDPIEWLETHDSAEVIWLPVSAQGVVDLIALDKVLNDRGDEIALISLMWANNETGVITDIREVTALATKHGVPVHSDAVAAFGHMPVNFALSGLAAMSITAHKIAGPIGVGALILSRGSTLISLIHGGGQERSVRSGTMNAAGAIAFAHAADLAVKQLEQHTVHTSALLQKIREFVETNISGSRFSRGDEAGLSMNAHFTFDGLKSDGLLFLLDQAGFAVSAGSACQAGVARASHVLLAMGRTESEANSSLRITFGQETATADIDAFLEALVAAVDAARKAN